jgi:amino acid transporter
MLVNSVNEDIVVPEYVEKMRNGQYKKVISPLGAAFLSLGAILGSGVPFIVALVMYFGGPAGLLSWVVAGIIASFIAVVFAEIAAIVPRTGGVAVYPHVTNGPIAGTLSGWGTFVGYILSPLGAAIAIVELLSFFVPPLYNSSTGFLSFQGELLTLLIVFLFFGTNYLGTSFVNKTNIGWTYLKVFSLVGIIIFFLAFDFHPSNLTSFKGGFMPYGPTGIMLGAAATVIAYTGFRQPIDFAEEMKNPKKDMRKAVLLSIGIAGGIYFMLSLIFIGAINWNTLGLQPGNWKGLGALAYPLPELGFMAGLAIVAYFLFATSIHATYSCNVVYSGSAARVFAAMSEDGYFPSIFAKLSKRSVPYVSIFAVLFIQAIYLFLIPAFLSVALAAAGTILISYASGGVSLMVLKKLRSDQHENIVIWWIVTFVAFAAGGLLIYWAGWNTVKLVVPSVFIGLLLLAYYSRKVRITKNAVMGGIWFPAYLAFVIFFSYYGSAYFGGKNVIPFPLDIVVFCAISVLFYLWGIKSGLTYIRSMTPQERVSKQVTATGDILD